MNENTGNSGNDFFYDLLDNPADLSHSNAFNLQLLINDFPQSGLLRSMLVVKPGEETLQRASAYVNPKLLYKIANAVSSLSPVGDDQIVFCEKPGEGVPLRPLPGTVALPNLSIDESNYFHVPIEADVAYIEEDEDVTLTEDAVDEVNSDEQEVVNEVPDTEVVYDTEVTDESETATEAEESIPSSEAEEITGVEEEPAVVAETEAGETTGKEEMQYNETEETEIAEKETTAEPLFVPRDEADAESQPAGGYDEYVTEDDQTDDEETGPEEIGIGEKPSASHQEIDDDVYEEIVSIEDIGLEQLALMGKATVKDDAEQDEATAPQETEGEPAGDSYFVFEPTLPEDEVQHAPANIVAQQLPNSKSGRNVSRYNDEKMPYSFMWWLDKTRKEHAAIYQPFVVDGKFHTATVAPAEKQQPAADHLQQQYYENIFAVSAVVADLNVTPPKVEAPPLETKEDKIIDKFIHEEPQIKHPSSVKLNNENKAKKSSEDRDELVTETLAKIYTEQMLYHKAILTYKKLMLKFPEKSLYFAGQIEQLENKIN